MIKMLNSLTQQPSENCIFLTYNVDLLFFEYMVFDPLYAAGCRNVLIMCDPGQYQVALRDASELRHAGQRYPILPARTSLTGVFHPKLVLQTSANSGRVFLMSGNVTKAGYTANWEVVNLFEYSTKKPDSTSLLVCQWAFDTLSMIASASDSSNLARKSLDQLWSTTAWLRQERPMGRSARIWPLHNIARPLLEQVLEQYRRDDSSPVREVVVVSPFFDTRASAIDRLLGHVQPQQLTLLTQGHPPGLDPRALQRILARYPLSFQATDLALAGRRLHAKALVLRTERGVWVASGSANFTAPAWLRRAEQGNTEMVMLRYETDPTHFDSWLDELMGDDQPLNLDWEPAPIDENPFSPATSATMTLVGASVEGHYLVLNLAQRLPQSNLVLHLDGVEPQQIGVDQWLQTDDNTVRMQLTQEILAQLERPTLVSIEIASPTGDLRSNPMLVHHLRVLSRSSQPVRRRERPQIPVGMTPDSYEHCAQILDMLTDLLASNTEQLNRHRGRTAAYMREERLAHQMELEEGYNPEDHFVEERVQVAATLSGGDLYADYDDRMTYEELLRAVLAAVYQPSHSIDEMPSHLTEGKLVVALSEPQSLLTDAELRMQMLTRIERGFQRLIGNFVRGTNDPEYITSVPPSYLTELFVILLTFLRTTHRAGMVTERAFAQLSRELLSAFWGDVGQPGAWQSLRERLTASNIDGKDARFALGAQTWFHAAVVADILSHLKERWIYDFAGWMRQMRRAFRGPKEIAELEMAAYQHLWQTTYSAERVLLQPADLIAQLEQCAQIYDEEALCSEIDTVPGARAQASVGEIARLRQVPKLDVHMPLDEADLDRCLRMFIIFLQWPQPKNYAWARFTNSNPLAKDDDLVSITIFYRDDDNRLSFGAKRANGTFNPDVEQQVTRLKVRSLQSVDDLETQRHIQP